MNKITLLSLLLVLSSLTACAGVPVITPEPFPLPTSAGSTPGLVQDTQTPVEATDQPATSSPSTLSWLTFELINVQNDEPFTIHDFTGKVVLVENFAMWCPKCKQQQEEVREFHALIANDPDLVFIALDIDPNEVAADLKTYVTSNNFPWIYAISPPALSREITNLYGDQFLNAPSTPMLIIDRQGAVHPLPFGIKTAEDLQAAVAPFLAQTN